MDNKMSLGLVSMCQTSVLFVSLDFLGHVGFSIKIRLNIKLSCVLLKYR